MKTLAQRFLTKEEQNLVRQAVKKAEEGTSGEIVPMIVSASHDYPEAAITGGAVLAFLPALAGAIYLPQIFWLAIDPLWFFLPLFFILHTLLFFSVRRLPALLYFFLWQSRVDKEVERGAFTSFFAENLQATRDKNGVLLYISVFERKAWILGDKGIDDKIEPEKWQSIIEELTQGVKNKQQGKSLCKAIDQVKEILKNHFPIKQDDENELRDLIIEKNDHGDGLIIR